MTRSIAAIYENGVFRPTEPVDDLPEHASVRLTIDAPATEVRRKRILGLQRDQIIYVSPDFDAELGDEFWFGEQVVKVLLDTHAFILFVGDPDALPDKARMALEDPDNDLLLSLASPWEMQIKVGAGKLRLHKPPRELVQFEVDRDAITLLPISLAHIDELSRLPAIHRDPFDRMLIAQARCEGLKLVSGDGQIRSYPVECLWD